MNQENPDEAAAKRIIERHLGGRVQLEHADTFGGADYLSTDAAIAVEVTRVTDGDIRKSRDAAKRSLKADVSGPALHSCWTVIADEKLPGQKTLRQRLRPLLADMESAGETRFDRQRGIVHVLEKGPLSQLYLPLLKTGIETAESLPRLQRDPEHVHHLVVFTGGGGSASGSDDALELLVDALKGKPDNPKKLAESGAAERHLFVWIDGDTPYAIERPLSRPPVRGTEEYFGLPSASPELDPAITHLWVVHERTKRGWYWDGLIWAALESS